MTNKYNIIFVAFSYIKIFGPLITCKLRRHGRDSVRIISLAACLATVPCCGIEIAWFLNFLRNHQVTINPCLTDLFALSFTYKLYDNDKTEPRKDFGLLGEVLKRFRISFPTLPQPHDTLCWTLRIKVTDCNIQAS